jgi:GT2 family glycosyltransferase
MSGVELSVIVVNWNGRDQIGRCLDSIPAAAAGRRTEVIVVDNLSTDSSIEYLRERYPEVTLIENQANLGYARGAQCGIDVAQGEFIAVANPDIVLDVGTLDHLVGTLEERPQAAWTGPKIVQPDGHIQSGPFRICPILEPLETTPVACRFYHPKRTMRHDRVQRCERLSGAVMLFRASMLRDMGGMPASTFLFGEEILLGALCRDHGYEVWYDPLCTALHEHGASVRQKWDDQDRKLATRVGHLAALRQAVSYPRFLAYDLVLLGTLFFKLLLGWLGRPFDPHLTWRSIKISLLAIFKTPKGPGEESFSGRAGPQPTERGGRAL